MVLRCSKGHVSVVVPRGRVVVSACPDCVRDSLKLISSRRMTVGNYISRLEMDGQPPKLSVSDADSAESLMLAAQSRHGDCGVGGLRALVRACAKNHSMKLQEVMSWTLEQMVRNLATQPVTVSEVETGSNM